MAEKRALERLTASDLFLLWDDYGWSSDIGGLAILDGAELLDSAGAVRMGLVRQRLEPRLDLVPRFRQLLYRPRFGLGWPLWVDAPDFDFNAHVRVRPLAGPDQAELLQACAELAARPLDRAKPLWELWLLPGLSDGRLGAYLKLHHAIADGTAAIAVFGALLDVTGEPSVTRATPWQPAPIPGTAELLRDNIRRRGAELRRAGAGFVHPLRTVSRTRKVLPAWREVLTDKPSPHTSLNRPVGKQRRLALIRGGLDVTKQIAHANGAKVGDVVLTVVAGGLRKLLARRGELGHGLEQRAMMTLSEHQEKDGLAQGNKPGWMMVPLPLSEPDAVRRLWLIAAETAAGKNNARPEAGTGPFRFVLGQRVWYWMFPHQRAVNVVVSNVPGPPVPLYLAGSRLLEVFPMMPTMGNLTLVVAALSYAGQMNITVIADADGCPDVEVFAQGARATLETLAQSIPVAVAS